MTGKYAKLKTNLKVAIQRLKLLEKKKTENARKSTKEIADLIQANKVDRARIKVEHIIREDYLVESMEIVEMYCDLLLARFGLIESMKELDPGLDECVSSLFWVGPRLESECNELRVITDELQHKYGKEYALAARANKLNTVNPKLMQKMSEQAPNKLLVEKYLVEIAASHKVPFKPDQEMAYRDPDFFYASLDKNNGQTFYHTKESRDNNNDDEKKGGPGGPPGGGASGGGGGGGGGFSEPPAAYYSQPLYPTSTQVSHIGLNPANSVHDAPAIHKPGSAATRKGDTFSNDFEFPAVPDTLPSSYYAPKNNSSDQSESFDELSKRFENLKRK